MKQKQKKSSKNFKYIYDLIRDNKKTFIATVLMNTILTFSLMIAPKILQFIMDNEIDPNIGIKNYNSFGIYISLFLIVIIMSSIIKFVTRYVTIYFANIATKTLRKSLYKKIFSLKMEEFTKTPIGKYANMIVSNIDSIGILFFSAIPDFFTGIFIILLLLLYVIIYLPAMVPVILFSMALTFLVSILFNKFSFKYQDENTKLKAKLSSDLNETIKGIETIRSYNVYNELNNYFKKSADEVYISGTRFMYPQVIISWNIPDLIPHLMQAGLIFVTALKFLQGQENYTIGSIMLLLNFSNILAIQINGLIHSFPDYSSALSALNIISEVFDLKEEQSGKYIGESIEGNVEFENVYFEYNENIPVLKDISFKLNKGKSLALVGHTGSGKSSIISLLFKLYDIKKGKIKIDNKNISDYDLKFLRSQMAFVLQDPVLFDGSLRLNIALEKNVTDDEIINALIACGGKHLLDTYTLDSPIQDDKLSLGEKQIITFARAMIKNPKILVLDEATASIDSQTEVLIQEGLKNLSKNRTTIMIAHRLSTIRSCDNIIVLDHGEIKESGTHDDLIKNNSYYSELIKAEERIKKR